jgi:hypothetical protein
MDNALRNTTLFSVCTVLVKGRSLEMIAFNGIESAIYRLRSVNVPSPLSAVTCTRSYVIVWPLAIVLQPSSLSHATLLTVLIRGLMCRGFMLL